MDDLDTAPMEAGHGSDSVSTPGGPMLERVGRYRVIRRIGRGSFGDVFLALDEKLQRSVAVKVMSRTRDALPADLNEDDILEEGRLLAQLHHPGIVEVFDTGHDEMGRFFFASQYLEGQTLAESMKQAPLPHKETALIVAQVAEALSYAHSRSVIHRDVKPNNIILMDNSRPVLIDFGIATRFRSGMGRFVGVIGTPGYMSPEQARGESHLVDGRSDLFSLGVILFQMLTGRRPFEGSGEEMLECIASPTFDAPPPRQIDPAIPKPLERISLKALAKRPADRYATAGDFASDLREFLAGDTPDSPREITSKGVHLMPKGLRSFDSGDADFFLSLLPGLRDQSGIPNSLRYWLRGIAETRDPFRVGVLYGPSGSGKSSFLAAGLIPRLPPSVVTIFIRAGTGDLGEMVRAQLLRDVPALALEIARSTFKHRVHRNPVAFLSAGIDVKASENVTHSMRLDGPAQDKEDLNLGDLIRRLREGSLLPAGVRVLIVIDQFEQWLHRQEGGRYETTDLFAALRQCDGHRVQFLLSVRDDFWMAIARLMNDIDVELIQSKNASGIELFDRGHARSVLRGFGHAYGCLSVASGPASEKDADTFIETVLKDMEVDGLILPLQIALFAEISKSIPWRVGAYRALGGRTAIGIEFLDSIFSRRSANPAYRTIEAPAREILRALLPTGGGTLKEQPIGIAELRERADCGQDEKRFESIVRVLDEELRLLSPVDGPDGTPNERRYQLSHDYLVPALREWLNAAEKGTLRGRTRIRLRELTAAWRLDRDRRHLPTFWEWLRIRVLVPRQRWDSSESELMTSARVSHSWRIAIFSAACFLVASAALQLVAERRVEREIGELLLLPVPHLVQRMTEDAARIKGLHEHLIERIAAGDLPIEARINAALLLAGEVPSEAQFLFDQCPHLPPEAAVAAIDRITPIEPEKLAGVRSLIMAPRTAVFQRLRLACLLLKSVPEDPLWGEIGPDLSHWLLSAAEEETALWAAQFYPLRDHLLPHLPRTRQQFTALDPDQAHQATIAQAAFRRENPDALLGLLEEVNNEDIRIVIEALRRLEDDFLPRLSSKVAQYLGQSASGDPVGPTAGRRAARYAIALLALSDGANDNLSWDLLKFQPDPTGRSHLIDLLPHSGLTVGKLLARIEADVAPDQREAIIQAIGGYPLPSIDRETKNKIQTWLLTVFRDAGDPGTHASVEWLLRRWGEIVPDQPRSLASSDPENRRWFTTLAGSTFSIIRVSEAEARSKRLPRRYAVAQTETTLADFLKSRVQSKWSSEVSPLPDCPVAGVDQNGMMQFANWLSREEGISESQWCYADDGKGLMIAKPEFTRLAGYRLPTWGEWHFAATAGAATEIPFGSGKDLQLSYLVPAKRLRSATTDPVHNLRPNRFGLFDVVGNLAEICHSDADSGSLGILAGGSFATFVESLELQRRELGYGPYLSNFASHGFRLAITLDSGAPK